jgi:hypothetical protein
MRPGAVPLFRYIELANELKFDVVPSANAVAEFTQSINSTRWSAKSPDRLRA